VRALPLLAAAIALAVAPRARAGAPPAPRDPAPRAAPAGERVEIVVRRPTFLSTGTFRAVSAHGTLHDRGTARDRTGPETPEMPLERLLEGEKGTLRLRLLGSHKGAPFPIAMFGRWTVVDATGAYAGLRGEGTYTVTDGGGEDKAQDVELHTLVGVLRREGR
jgi:hypothetical protein